MIDEPLNKLRMTKTPANQRLDSGKSKVTTKFYRTFFDDGISALVPYFCGPKEWVIIAGNGTLQRIRSSTLN